MSAVRDRSRCSVRDCGKLRAAMLHIINWRGVWMSYPRCRAHLEAAKRRLHHMKPEYWMISGERP